MKKIMKWDGIPITSNQKLKEHIHKLCRMAGITQPTGLYIYI